MRLGFSRLLAAIVFVAFAAVASAQMGHPLKGTWTGDWGPNKDARTHVLMEINWDGKALTGTLNPGPNGVPLSKIDLDPSTWTVQIEADGKDKAGAAVHYAIDGKLENLGSYYRTLTGTWRQGSMKGDFKLTRN